MATNEIASGFVKVKDVRELIRQKLHMIGDVKETIRHTYMTYVEKERVDCFGLDSFLFQNKLIELQEECEEKVYCYIDNRMYGDYFKLFGLIRDFLQKHLTTSDFQKIQEFEHGREYPVYKDLEKFKVYDFDVVNQIHADIISILEQMRAIHEEGERRIEESRKKLDFGMAIDNYVTNQEHLNEILRTKTTLFCKYLSTYHLFHHRIMMGFHQQIDLFYRQIDEHRIKKASDL